jgi:hypothetical protein
MIYLNDESLKKIELLDKLLSVLSPEDIEELCKADFVAAKLKNTNTETRILAGMILEIKANEKELKTLNMDMLSLRADCLDLIRAVNRLASPPVPVYCTYLSNLKSKYNVD